MNTSAAEILTIQKFIFLLDDFHYKEFRSYLLSINAALPLKLADSIREKLPHFDTHEDVCKKIYNGFEKNHKQTFNQLSSHTFRLSHTLALNYPDYLHHNIQKIQVMVNKGLGDEAYFLASALLEIAGKVEDFQCQVFALKFLSQRAFLIKDIPVALKLDSQLCEVVETQKLFYTIQSYTRKLFYIAKPISDRSQLPDLRAYYDQFSKHPSAAVRIISLYGYISMLDHFNFSVYEDEYDKIHAEKLEKELYTNAHVVLPFLADLHVSFGYIKLNSGDIDLKTKDGQRALDELSEHNNGVKFWSSYVNAGLIYLITIDISRLMSQYHSYINRSDYYKTVTDKDRQKIKDTIDKSAALLQQVTERGHLDYAVRTLKMLHGAALILSGGSNIKEGVQELESLLIEYQQVNMKGATDGIYMCLMVGYFALKDYEHCSNTYKRYIKVIKDKPVFEGNDLKIYAYYYLAQWLDSGSKQYAEKLHYLITKEWKGSPPKAIIEMARYYHVPTIEAMENYA